METNKNKGNARKFDFYVLLFFLLAFAGWLWEVGIYLVTRQSLVNRGVYFGPYLPIYGVGGLALWFLLQRLHQKPFVTFLLSAALCSVLEYGASVWLEWKWGMRWWDYSGFFLNLNGRICQIGADVVDSVMGVLAHGEVIIAVLQDVGFGVHVVVGGP